MVSKIMADTLLTEWAESRTLLSGMSEPWRCFVIFKHTRRGTNAHISEYSSTDNRLKDALTSVYVCWFRGSDRVRGISLITWDEEAERFGQHVKDGPPISWSSAPRTMLLFLHFVPITECWCGINAQIAYSHHIHCRTEKNQGTGSAEFLKNPSKTKTPEVVSTLWALVFTSTCAAWTFVVLSSRCGFVV